jgi:hypothetical protein
LPDYFDKSTVNLESNMPGFKVADFSDSCAENAGNKPSGGTLFREPPNTLETARTHRYKLIMIKGRITGQVRLDLDEFWPKKITRPTVEIDRITLHSGQDEIFRPGKQHYNPVEVVFYETINDSYDPSSATVAVGDSQIGNVFAWWANETIKIQDSRMVAPVFLDTTVDILQMGGQDNLVWRYQLYNVWPMKISPSDLDYSDSAISLTTVTLSYDKYTESR